MGWSVIVILTITDLSAPLVATCVTLGMHLVEHLLGPVLSLVGLTQLMVPLPVQVCDCILLVIINNNITCSCLV